MKTLATLIFSCLSVLAMETNDIHMITWSYKVLPENSLATMEVFTRGGRTNLIRQTHTKDGVVILRNQSFYHNGTEVGSYMYQTANGTNSGVCSTAGTPYYFTVGFDSSNNPRSAQIRTTNLVLLDWFPCTNGIFYPADNSLIQEANDRLSKVTPH